MARLIKPKAIKARCPYCENMSFWVKGPGKRIKDDQIKPSMLSQVECLPYTRDIGTFDNGKFKGSDTGNIVKITAGSDTQGNPVVRTMSVSEFNEFKAAFMPKEVTDKGLLPIVHDEQPKSSVRPHP